MSLGQPDYGYLMAFTLLFVRIILEVEIVDRRVS